MITAQEALQLTAPIPEEWIAERLAEAEGLIKEAAAGGKLSALMIIRGSHERAVAMVSRHLEALGYAADFSSNRFGIAVHIRW